MKNSKKSHTGVLVIILMALLILAFKTMYMSSGEDLLIEENIAASDRVEAIRQELESISFDTSVVSDEKLASLKSIEMPLISLPIGKKNPFSN